METKNNNFALRIALEDTLRMLGERTMQAVVYDLRIQGGINFDDPSLSLEKVSNGLSELLGEEVANMLVEEVILKMDEIAHEQQTDNPAT